MGKSSLATLQKEQKAIRKKLASKSAKKEKKKKSQISKSLEKKLASTNQTQNTKESNKENINIISFGKPSNIEERKEKEAPKPSLKKDAHNQSSKANMIETVNIPPESRPQNNITPKPVTVPAKQEQGNAKKLSKKERDQLKAEELIQEREDKVYPEHEAKVQNKFMKSLKQKKEIANRLAPKVTEVYPVLKTTKEAPQKVKDRDGPVMEVVVDEM